MRPHPSSSSLALLTARAVTVLLPGIRVYVTANPDRRPTVRAGQHHWRGTVSSSPLRTRIQRVSGTWGALCGDGRRSVGGAGGDESADHGRNGGSRESGADDPVNGE